MKRLTILFIALYIPLIVLSQDIDYAEYFIDTDPGYGTANPITVSAPGNDISLGFSADIASLQQGLHYMVVRARDDQGQWSHGVNTVFYIVKSPDAINSIIDRAEYFIDTDPGFGMAVSIPIPAPGNDLALQLSPGLESMDPGLHYINFRARDVSGRWGSVMNTIFLFVEMPSSAESQIQQVEYFIDTDPGFGLGTQLTLPSSGSDLTIDFTASLSGLDDGNHVLYIRAKNEQNKWGQVYAEGFAYTATGVGDEEILSLFKIYPNPSSGTFQVEISDQLSDEFIISLMDMNGKLVYETDCYDRQCDLKLNLPGGMYLLNIKCEEYSISQKIILE
ncbi:MAG: hypothetical protein DRI83_11500 [Bacteroidetes bacterium]|nr:MAG: hypothetical protein DRI83_11500 [Bacteroidota bacterium]